MAQDSCLMSLMSSKLTQNEKSKVKAQEFLQHIHDELTADQPPLYIESREKLPNVEYNVPKNWIRALLTRNQKLKVSERLSFLLSEGLKNKTVYFVEGKQDIHQLFEDLWQNAAQRKFDDVVTGRIANGILANVMRIFYIAILITPLIEKVQDKEHFFAVGLMSSLVALFEFGSFMSDTLADKKLKVMGQIYKRVLSKKPTGRLIYGGDNSIDIIFKDEENPKLCIVF
jgi:hypothetical protein